MLKIGTAEIDITPPLAVPMSGYAARKSGVRGIHDAIFARIVVDNGQVRIGWVIAELIGMRTELTQRSREAACESAGIAPECVMFSTTHNHGGPRRPGTACRGPTCLCSRR